MSGPDDPESPKPETLRLFRKKYPPLAIALAVVAVVLAILFLIYMIWSAMQPPDLHDEHPPTIR
jgi:hypothetical protein